MEEEGGEILYQQEGRGIRRKGLAKKEGTHILYPQGEGKGGVLPSNRKKGTIEKRRLHLPNQERDKSPGIKGATEGGKERGKERNISFFHEEAEGRLTQRNREDQGGGGGGTSISRKRGHLASCDWRDLFLF